MNQSRLFKTIAAVSAVAIGLIGGTAVQAQGRAIPARTIKDLDAPGGLIVHVGADDAARTAALNQSGSFLLHFLYTDADAAQKASSVAVECNLAGKVTVSVFDGENLPFVDNMVNLLIVEDGPKLSAREMMRVLAPGGSLLALRDGQWKKDTKPVPSSIDEWPHNLCDPGNTGVSRDLEAGSPRHLQWTGNPRFSRSHDGNSSFLAMVSAGGRVFYMMDEGSTAFLSLPSKWILTARDGFNGKVLWKKPLDQPLLTHVGQIKNSFANLGHRMVAQDDVIYVTLGFNAPISALDSRTGNEIWKSKATANAEELILFDGVLYCLINLSEASRAKHPFQSMEPVKRRLAAAIPRKLLALDAKAGKILWEKKPPRILPLSLTAGGHGVFIHDGRSIVSLAPKNGDEQWRSEPIAFYSKLQQYSGVNLVLKDDVLLFACGTAYPHKTRDYKSEWQNTITALNAKTGKVLWRAPHRQDGIFVTPDLLIADGLVWNAPIDSGHSSGDYAGLDLKTGKVVRDFKGDNRTQMPHHRCYRNRGTERFIFTGWTGVNIFDVRTGKWDHNYWIRGACRYGVMPANGLLYNTPSVCTCYINAKIKGLNALADDSKTRRLPDVIPETGRPAKGPAFSKGREQKSKAGRDWPTYRGSSSRHGVASSALSEAYAAGWKTRIGGRLTQPVIADGNVLVAAHDQHAVYSLDENDGRVKWRFQAGSVVDSPPTAWKGRAVFGCRDGWVYCLTIADGQLVWKYRAAPLDRRIIACENLESVWPVHGSVLVLPDPRTGRGRVYTISGRSIFLDGGLRSLVLDAETGEKISETVMNHIDPDTGKNIQEGTEWLPDMPAGLPDILSYGNRTIYMGVQPFTLDGKRKRVYYPRRRSYGLDGRGAKPLKKRKDNRDYHLFSTIGFLDDSEMHRSAWMYGRDSFGGCWGYPVAAFSNPAGNIMCMDGENVYGYGREFYNEGKKPTTHLFATTRNPDLISFDERFKGRKVERRNPYLRRGLVTVPKPTWSRKIGTHVRALLTARNRDPRRPNLLCAVGTPEVIDEYDAIELIDKQQRSGFKVDEIYKKEKSIAGELGARLMVISTADGNIISKTDLEYPAVFDGMSAANGKIFISDIKGRVVCLAPAGAKAPATSDSAERPAKGDTVSIATPASPLSGAGTLPPLKDGRAPQTFEGMWSGFDPRKEPLEVEVLKKWEQDGVVLKVLRYRIGIFKGSKAVMAAVYGYPKGKKNLPGLVQIHGGGQYADYRACVTNAKRGYATISIAWAGRISAPGYTVNPTGVKLFWDGKTRDRAYRKTTDWGALDAYHAPCRSPKNSFANVKPHPWTLDAIDSPRNNPWFLVALGARRALTFLERQPEVDKERLGVYGHSMGGKLTVMTVAADSRVRAAAPSCGGVSNRDTGNALYDATIADDVNLGKVSCPIVFLSPANDFHGTIDGLQSAVKEIKSREWRVTCSPHHNHQDTAAYEVATQLWFDQVFRKNFTWPKTPASALALKAKNGIPTFSVTPDPSRKALSVDIFYTQHGSILQGKRSRWDMENAINRFWHHARPRKTGDRWTASLPLVSIDKPLWVYANVLYQLDKPVSGAGYYYGSYTADSFNLSSLMSMADPEQLKKAGVRATMAPALVIEDFKGDWKKEWFIYSNDPQEWQRRTHKVYDAKYRAPESARLMLEVRSRQPNKLVIGLDKTAAEVELDGGSKWQKVVLFPADFKDTDGKKRTGWKGIRELRLSREERLRPKGGGKPIKLGAKWKGAPPEFRSLRWVKEPGTK